MWELRAEEARRDRASFQQSADTAVPLGRGNNFEKE